MAVVILGTLLSAGQLVQAADKARFVPGVSAGVAYTPDSDFSSVGWTASATVEHLVSEVLEIRARAGVISLRADVDGERPDATYIFATAEALGLDLVSPTGGIGLYHVDLEKPLSDDGDSSVELGVNAGIRVLLPYHHGDRGLTIDGTIHHVFADGPGLLLTMSAGWVF